MGMAAELEVNAGLFGLFQVVGLMVQQNGKAVKSGGEVFHVV